MRKILGLLILVSGMAFGQEMDTVVVDSVKKVSTYFGGAYINVGSKLAPNPPGLNQTNSIGGGIQYNRWSLGFMINDFVGTTERFLIFPNVFELRYRSGGPVVSLDVVQTEWFSLAMQASFSAGDMVWREKSDNRDFLRSKFNMVTFGAKAELSKLRFLRPYLHAGYQQMSDLELSGVDNDDFSGFFFGVGLRVGYFNQ